MAVAALAAAVWAILPRGGGQQAGAQLRTAEVIRGDLVTTVTGTGALQPARTVELSFSIAGRVELLNVEAGDFVMEGATLARLDTVPLEIALEQARSAYHMQLLSYRRLIAPPSEYDLRVAEANLTGALASYRQAASGPDPLATQIAEMRYRQARLGYLIADANLRAIQARPYVSDEQRDAARAQAGQAWAAAESSRTQWEALQGGADPNAVSVAWAQVRQAQVELERLRAGVRESDRRRALIAIEQALEQVRQAQRQLDEASLIAPFTGLVATVNVQEGAPAPIGRPAVVMMDVSRYYVDLEVDELDVPLIEVGQEAYLELDAFPDETVEARVESISQLPVPGDTITYRVRLALEPTSLPLRVGMTAVASIVVEVMPDRLLIPNWAVQVDRDAGRTFAYLLEPDTGALREVDLEIGARNEEFAEVLSGLDEGDVVAVPLQRREFTFTGFRRR